MHPTTPTKQTPHPKNQDTQDQETKKDLDTILQAINNCLKIHDALYKEELFSIQQEKKKTKHHRTPDLPDNIPDLEIYEPTELGTTDDPDDS